MADSQTLTSSVVELLPAGFKAYHKSGPFITRYVVLLALLGLFLSFFPTEWVQFCPTTSDQG